MLTYKRKNIMINKNSSNTQPVGCTA